MEKLSRHRSECFFLSVGAAFFMIVKHFFHDHFRSEETIASLAID
jgi:hypothetical protein